MSDPRAKSDFVHPLQSIVDAMGDDATLEKERRRIQEYISKSAVALSGADPSRTELVATKLEQMRKEARAEVTQIQMAAPLSERDKEWLQITIEMIRVLGGMQTADGEAAYEAGPFFQALIKGAFARLAPEELVEVLAREKSIRQAEEEARKEADTGI